VNLLSARDRRSHTRSHTGLRLLIIGDFSNERDEGFKNVSHEFSERLGTRHHVTNANVKQVERLAFWRTTLSAKPDVIHLIAQPTLASLIVLYLLKLVHRRAGTLVSALRPASLTAALLRTPFIAPLLRALRPDLVLAADGQSGLALESIGYRVANLGNGVDLLRFKPVPPDVKRELRVRNGLDPDRPLALHVGHLSRERNLLVLKDLPPTGIQVLIVGSVYMGLDEELMRQLEDLGFRLLVGYQSNVPELYAMADCYVFPPKPGTSLAMPLSVLEAMATGLPIVTTRFAGLLDAFSPSNAFHYADENGSFLEYVSSAINAEGMRNRELVSEHSWDAIVERLETYYLDLIPR
jgi:glycosyltransferase involved in cell wall biosynthesis